MNESPFDLIIIGCGTAGIGAAIKFQQLNPTARFVILDARDRVGGRAYTDSNEFGPHLPIDLGARWLCHPQSDNPLFAYYTPSDQDWIESDIYETSTMDVFDENGMKIEPHLIKQAQQIVQELIATVEKYPLENIDISMMDVIRDQFLAIENKQMQRLVRMCLSYTENHEGSDLAQLSTRFYSKGEGNLDESDLALATGLGNFIKQIVDRHQLPIELNKVVTHVDASSRSDQLVNISTRDGKTYVCKYVLITVPLGCLKAGSITFMPTLPTWKLEAINKMGYSLLNKIFLQFPSIFWDPKLKRISVAADRFKIFFCIPQANILVLYVSGSVAREIEQKTDEEIVQQVVKSLRQIYPQMSDPIKWLITRWGCDPFSFGSYSSFHVGSDPQMIKELARESHNGRLHWAGEHTNYNGCIGYVDSGFESGQREAILIDRKIKQSIRID